MYREKFWKFGPERPENAIVLDSGPFASSENVKSTWVGVLF